MKDIRSAYDRGRKAARSGKPNPYPPESALSASWLKGFASVGGGLPNEPDDITWRIEAQRASAEYARRWHAALERMVA